MIMAYRTEPVERPSCAIDHASQQCLTYGQLPCAVRSAAPRMEWLSQSRPLRVGLQRDDGGARGESVDVADRHEIQPVPGETDHFRLDRADVVLLDETATAYRKLESHHLQHQTGGARELAARNQRVHAGDASLTSAQEFAAVVTELRRARATHRFGPG